MSGKGRQVHAHQEFICVYMQYSSKTMTTHWFCGTHGFLRSSRKLFKSETWRAITGPHDGFSSTVQYRRQVVVESAISNVLDLVALMNAADGSAWATRRYVRLIVQE